MIINYFKTAWRNILRSKANSTINILGLALGLACTLLIVLFVKDELTYDQFLNNTENIYRITSVSKFQGETRNNGNTGLLQGPQFTANVQGITDYVRIQGDAKVIKTGDDILSQNLLRVDPAFFKIFSYPVVEGDRNTCLKDPANVVISEKIALQFFGTTNAIGKRLMMKGDSTFEPYTVTAIVKNVPKNATVKFDMLLPFQMSATDGANKENWFNSWLNTFVVVKPGADVVGVEKRMNDFFAADSRDALEQMKSKYGLKGEITTTYFLQPFLQMHLSESAPPQNGLSGSSKASYSYILGGIALFILLIACINFINLSLAQSMKRAKEIGIRKVMGGGRKQLIGQFLGESFLLCTIAFVIALGIVWLALPLFNKLSGKELAFGYLFDLKLLFAFIAILVISALLAGFYPALILSSFTPVKTLYNRFRFSGKVGLQRVLVVFQFSLASLLIVATLIMYHQFRFMAKYDLGMDNKNVLTVNNYGVSPDNYNYYRNVLLQNPAITDVTVTNSGYVGNMVQLPNDSNFQAQIARIGSNYIPFFGLKLIKGRNVSGASATDSVTSVIVNEALVKKSGWKEPIGQSFKLSGPGKSYTVVGVVKDYHTGSILDVVDPLVLTMSSSFSIADIHIRIKEGQNTAAMQYVEKSFKQVFAGTPYHFNYRDDVILQFYEMENRWKKIMLIAALITIFISGIGLFGMAVLAAEKRTKEVGIRKVLGATVSEISVLLTREFLLLVIIAMTIAFPVAWMLGNKWLQHYAYRIEIGWLLFVIAAAITLSIALFTVTGQAIKAATANPIKSLRTE